MLKDIVFNPDEKMYLGTLSNAIDIALARGFRFLMFNGIVYLLMKDGRCYDTGLEKRDLIDKV